VSRIVRTREVGMIRSDKSAFSGGRITRRPLSCRSISSERC
jgi:hypothetical protein